MLNPNLDRQELAFRFDQDGRLRIEDVLDDDVAERVREACLHDVPFEYVYHLDGVHCVAPAEEMASLDATKQQEITDKVMDAASRGVGFIYCGYMIRRADRASSNANLQFLHSIFEYLNGDEMLST